MAEAIDEAVAVIVSMVEAEARKGYASGGDRRRWIAVRDAVGSGSSKTEMSTLGARFW